MLLLFPAVLSFFTLRPSLPGLQFLAIEVLLLSGPLAYAFLFQRLRQPEPDRRALAFASGLSVGCVTLIVLLGGIYGLLAYEHPRRRLLRPYTWAEITLFAFLAFLSLVTMTTSLRLRRQTVGPKAEPLSLGSILVVPASLVVYALILILFSMGD